MSSSCVCQNRQPNNDKVYVWTQSLLCRLVLPEACRPDAIFLLFALILTAMNEMPLAAHMARRNASIKRRMHEHRDVRRRLEADCSTELHPDPRAPDAALYCGPDRRERPVTINEGAALALAPLVVLDEEIRLAVRNENAIERRDEAHDEGVEEFAYCYEWLVGVDGRDGEGENGVLDLEC